MPLTKKLTEMRLGIRIKLLINNFEWLQTRNQAVNCFIHKEINKQKITVNIKTFSELYLRPLTKKRLNMVKGTN